VGTNFYNHVPASLNDTELVTWALMKAFIDQIFPIGCIQLSKNNAPPSTFGGYITWSQITLADGKYLRCYAGGAQGGFAPATVTAGSVQLHTHATPSITIPAQTVTSGNNTTITATTGNTAGSTGTPVNALGTQAAAGPPGSTSLNFSPHTHQVPIPSQVIAGGVTTPSGGTNQNECDNYSVLIYERTA